MEHYENLQGGTGREAYFRAPRYSVDELGGGRNLSATLAGHPVSIGDMSLTGASVVDHDTARMWPDQITHECRLEIRIAGRQVLAGIAEIVRTELYPSSVRIGVRFVDWCPDLSELTASQLQSRFRANLEDSATIGPDLVPAAYKAICADVVHLLNWQRDLLEELDAAGGWSDTERAARLEAAQALEEKVLERWRHLWQSAENAVRGLDMNAPEFLAVKQYTEQVLTPVFMSGAIWDRSYNKPRGYPGDYAIMKMVYNWSREGETLADRMVHRIGLEVAECIATRMILVQKAIAETIARFGQAGEARITSLGCGPAKEIENVLSSTRLAGRARFTLIDQDEEALIDTSERLLPAVAAKGGQAAMSVLRESFMGIVRGGGVTSTLDRQHLIYSVGLVDYLRAGMARNLVTKLYSKLEPGGLLIIGNMADSELSNYWPMEFIADWRVEYRNRDEMLDMATRCDGAEIDVRRESTGRVWMLYIRKPS